MIDKVLVLSQRNSQVWRHMSADMAHGFRRLGCDVQFCEELQDLVARVTVDQALRVTEGRKMILDGWTWEHRAKRILEVVFGSA